MCVHIPALGKAKSGLSRRGVMAAGAIGALGVASLSLNAARADPSGHERGKAVALTGVTVIDATGSAPLPDATIVIRNGRIKMLGRRHQVTIPPDATVVDMTGKYVIPGLAEMHSHNYMDPRILPPLYVATGVTTVREMTANPLSAGWRDQIESGDMLGPRFTIGSLILDGKPSLWAPTPDGPFLEITTAEQGRKAVRQAKDDGADFIKVYSQLSPEAYHAIAEESHEQGLPYLGHPVDQVPVMDAVEAGVSGFEHCHFSGYGVSSHEDEVRRILNDIEIGNGGIPEWFRQVLPADWLAATTYDSTRASETFAAMAEAGIRVTPTLSLHRMADLPDQINRDRERLKYLPYGTQDVWEDDLENIFYAELTPEDLRKHREVFQYRQRTVADMRSAGVPVMTGTDTTVAYVYPGFGVHDEMAELVESGFTPLEAIQAATIEPARFLGTDHETGTVAKGKLADLVVLDADPLDDIANTLGIHAVVVRGALIDHRQREKLLDDIEAAAAEIE